MIYLELTYPLKDSKVSALHGEMDPSLVLLRMVVGFCWMKYVVLNKGCESTLVFFYICR